MEQDGEQQDKSGTTSGSAPPLTSRNSGEPKKFTDARRVLACNICRKRKLKCDSVRPKCGNCSRLGHPCAYDEARKKSGPKRGYVKELEARLKQVETMLTTQKDKDTGQSPPPQAVPAQDMALPTDSDNVFNPPNLSNTSLDEPQASDMIDPDLNMTTDFGLADMDDFNWDMIALGLEEPLPPPEIMDELYQVFFEKIHPSLPMIHRPRFMASFNMAPNLRPPVCLRYIMWALACNMIPKYSSSAEHFYQKARKYLHQDEMRGHGEHFVSTHHAQTWVLVSTYEFKSMYFPRAWMSCGRAARLSQLLGLHRQDRVGIDVKQTLPPPKDCIEREERRRTFWMAYCGDRYASIGTGWPMTIDERDILTNLPSSEEAFLTGRGEPTPVLADVMVGDGASGLSPLASVILMSTLFGRNLTHLHRPSDDDNDHDLNGEFWKRHRSLDNILLNTSLSLPSHLRLPYGLDDPNIIFTNMKIHTSTICLHQAAIFKADKHRLPAQVSAESKRRCIVAADQITNIMKMCSHQDLSLLNPVIAFCLYVAARVFVQYLKSKREDSTVRASLMFLLRAMQVLKTHNPLTESFMVQLDVDLEGSGLDIPSPLGPNRYAGRAAANCSVNTDSVKCIAIFDIHETQTLGQAAREVEGVRLNPDADVDFSGLGCNPMTHHHPDATQPVQPMAKGDRGVDPGFFKNHKVNFDNIDYNLANCDPGVGQNYNQGHAESIGSHSGHPTPSSGSNNLSSNTSYTPPTFNDGTSIPLRNDPRASFAQHSPPGQYQHRSASSNTVNSVHEWPGNQAQNNNSTGGAMPGTMGSPGGFGNMFSGSGLTPGPTGFTPGPTGMTPTAGWDGVNMSENNEWMFDGWNGGDQNRQPSQVS